MSEDNLILEKYFQSDEVALAKSLIREFHGRLLIDPQISNPTALLLSIYMLANEGKVPFVDKKHVKSMFQSLGRKSEEFNKSLYEVFGKRKESVAFIGEKDDKLGLNFEGLAKIKDVLRGKNG